MRILARAFADYFRDDGPMLAGAISCFFMLAVIPFLLLLVSIFGYLLGQDHDLYRFFLSQVVGLFPRVTHQITRELESIVRYREIGILTLVIYALFSHQLYVSLESAVRHIFKSEGKRPLVFSVLLSFLTITLLVAFMVISFAATWVISLLEPLHEFFPGLKVGVIARFLSGVAVPIFLVFLIATALYLLLPRKRIPLRNALWGGIFAALFLEAAKHLFTFYVTAMLSHLGTVYGSLTTIVTFLMWLFYSSSIFLVGAELVRNLEQSKRKGGS